MSDTLPIQHRYPEAVAHCYGCGHLNPVGHHFETVWDQEADEGVTRFTPGAEHTAIPGYVYGGVIASLLDCHGIGTAAAAVRRERGPDAALRYVTASLHVDYLKPTPLGPELEARGAVVEMKERKVVVDVRMLADGFAAGSLRAGADRTIGGTVLFESVFGTTGVGPSRPLYSFVAPIEFGDGGSINTGLALTGLDDRPFSAYLQLNNQNGNSLGTATLDVSANGHIADFIDKLMPGIVPASFEGSVVVTASREIGATVISLRPGIFTTFPVIQNRIFTRSFFAQFAHIAGLTSKLVLINPSPNGSATVTIQVRDQAGNAAAVTLSGQFLASGSKTLVIPPLGSVTLETQSDIIGSVEVSTQNFPVGGVVLFSSPVTGTAGVGESFPQTRFVLPLSRGSGTDTGVALVNTLGLQVVLTLTVRDASGAIVVQRQVTLQPRQQLAEFPNDGTLNLGLPDIFTGSLWVEADGEVAATVIRQSPGILTTFPVISLDRFITPCQGQDCPFGD